MRGATACLCVCVENDEKRWTKCCRVFVYISTHTHKHTHTHTHKHIGKWCCDLFGIQRRKDGFWGKIEGVTVSGLITTCATEGVTVNLLPLRVSLSVYYLCHWGCHCQWNGYYLCYWGCHCQWTDYYLCHWWWHCQWNDDYLCHRGCHCQWKDYYLCYSI